MKKYLYILLCVISIGLLGYTAYFALNSTAVKTVPLTASSTVQNATTTVPVEDKNTYTTKSGKKINIIEANPNGESLSTITITTTGFATNTPIVLDANKLTQFFYSNLNDDTFEELIITTQAAGSGSFGEVYIFTTASNTQLLPVTIPEISEEDTEKGRLFEGYMGHDSFITINNKLTREFPTYKKTDTNNEPTGPRKNIVYTIIEKNGTYEVVLSLGTTTATFPSNETKSATTTRN